MKKYLNAEQRNQFLVLVSILQTFTGNRNMTRKNPGEIQTILEQWDKSDNLTKDEHRSLKMVGTYLNKFCESVFERMDPKEKKQLDKRMDKFDFRLVDDYTLKKIYRDMQDKYVNAVVPRELFNKFCEEIMFVKCHNCKKCYGECELYDVFEENFIPESTYGLTNCKFATKDLTKKKSEKILKNSKANLKCAAADKLRKKYAKS